MPVSCQCEYCHASFTIPPSRIRRDGIVKYCSAQCYHRARTLSEIRLCPYCSQPFVVQPWMLKKGYGRFCSNHCARRSRVEAGKKTHPEYLTWFWNKTLRMPNGCLEWQGLRDKNGYGKYTYFTRTVLAHREAWELTYGLLLPGIGCLHRCDNPPCCDITHIFLGTNWDNSRDMMLKNRRTTRLAPLDVDAIRTLYAAGGQSMREVGARFGIDASHVHAIVHARIWKHRPVPLRAKGETKFPIESPLLTAVSTVQLDLYPGMSVHRY